MLYGRAGACQDFLRLRPYCLTKGAKCAPPGNSRNVIVQIGKRRFLELNVFVVYGLLSLSQPLNAWVN